MSKQIAREYDVLIAGAGIAGVAAALECARAGLRTALVEKTILLGGLATTGLINVYLPLCDGNGHQVTFGIAEELFHLSIKYGPGDIPNWRDATRAPHPRFRTPFSPASFILALDEALAAAGVTLWLDTLICAPVLRGNRVIGVEIETKSGRGELRARCVVDATGDADIAFRAGALCAEADNWLTLWAIQVSLARAANALAQPDQVSLLDVIRFGGDHAGEGAWDAPKFRGTDAEEITRFVLASRAVMREHYRAQHARGGETGRRKLFPVTLPAQAQFRTTRHIIGQTTLTDGQHGIAFADSIGLIADWRKPGFVWEIPYGTLLPRQVTGLLVAGRCIASEHDAWEVTRVIPGCALTGQVAGIAARLAAQRDTTPDQLDARDVQRELAQQRIPFHINDVIR
jgi:2-polyprenyl-6-methoxyphenol hydroxylase-like FAD-dependent oxidoreductase